MAKNILLLLFASICISAAAQTPKFKLVTVDFSKGNNPGKEYVELLVVGQKSCNEVTGGDSIANLSNYVLYDTNGDSVYYIKGDTLPGIASGKYRFPATSPWDSIPYGSMIVVYNGSEGNNKLPIYLDTTGKSGAYVVPASMLQLFNSDTTPPPPDSILPVPPSINLKELHNAYIINPVYPPYVNDPNNWGVESTDQNVSHNETPGYFTTDSLLDWQGRLSLPAVHAIQIGLKEEPRPFVTINGVTDTVFYCPSPFKFNGSAQLANTSQATFEQATTYRWFVNGVQDSIYTLTDTLPNGSDSLLKYIHQNYIVTFSVKSNLKCISGPDSLTTSYKAFNVYPDGDSLKVYIKSDSTHPLIDTLGRDSLGNIDSTISYKTFCTNSIVKFSPLPNYSGKSDLYTWYHNGAIVSVDSVYIDTSIIWTPTHSRDTIYCVLNSSLHCVDKPHDTTTIILTILDSIPIPTITIVGKDTTGKGNDSICSGTADSFYVKFTYSSALRDTSSKYQLQWWVNGNLSLQDTATYTDTSTTITKFGSATFNQGDSIQAILLATKTASCPYYSGSFVNPPDSLTDSSNIVHITVTQSITPSIIMLQPTQSGLCKFPFVDSIQFVAYTDSTMGAGTNPKFLWYLNGVLQQSNPSIAMYPGTDSARTGSDSIYSLIDTLSNAADSTVYIGNGNLQYGTDTIAVQVINTTSKCFVTSDTSAIVPFNLATFVPYPPTPSVVITPSQPLPLCSAGLPANVVMTPNGQQLGTKPIYWWLLNGTHVSDSSTYVYNTIHANDSITVFAKSSVGCAQPDTVNNILAITITNAVTPTASIPNTPLTFCANFPLSITPNTPVNGGSNPQYNWYKVGSNGNPDSLLGQSYGTNPFTFPILPNDTSDVVTWGVYTQMISNASCVTTDSAQFSDTVVVTINPYPNVAPIVGPSSVCNGAYITLTDATPSGNWISGSQSNATVDANGNVTGVNVGQTFIIYNVGNAYQCFSTQNTTIFVNPTTVLFDSLLHYNICSFPGMNMDTIYNDSTHGIWGIDPTSTATATVVPAVDANTNRPIGLITAFSDGLLYITDTIVNDCGTTVRRDTILVGPPIVPAIKGASGICVLGDSTLLTDSAIVQAGWTSSWTTTGNGNTILADTVWGTPSTVYVKAINSGIDAITYSVTNVCGTASSLSFTINVGPPATAGTITGSNLICTNSQTPLSDGAPGGIWVSQTPSIATVDQGGNVIGVSAGTDSIFYKVGNTCDTLTAGFQVTIIAAYTLPKIIGDTIVCNNSTFQYVDTATGFTSTSWSSLYPNLATIDPNSGILTSSTFNQGVDSVVFSYTNSCGTTTDTLPVIIGNPIVGPLVYKNPICANDTIIVSTIGTRGATSELWYSLNPAIANFINNSDTLHGVLVNGNGGGQTKFFYEISNKCGNVSNILNDSTIIVDSLPVVPSIVGKSLICFGDTAIYSDTATTGVWSINSAIATIDNAGHLQSISGGNAIIAYKETNLNSCSTVVTQTITVDTLITVAPITGANTIFCTGRSVGLADATPAGKWESGDTLIAKVDSVYGNVLSVNSGTTAIKYVVSDGYGCDTSKSVNITVFTTPPVTPTIASKDTLCGTESVQYINNTPNGVWIATNTAVTTVNAGLVTGVKAGVDSILFIVSASGCSDTAFQPVAVDTVPVVAKITGADSVCHGRIDSLSDATLGGVWSSSDATIASVTATGVVLGVSPGTAKISYIVGDTYNCMDTATTTYIVHPIPKIDSIKGLITLCVGKQWPFTDGEPNGVWSNVTGAVSVSPTGLVTGVIPNISDTIKYKIVQLGCDTTVAFPIGITIPHVAPITADTLSIPVGLTIDMKDASVPGFWTSIMTNIATVDSIASGVGRVTGVAKGQDSIMYTYVDPTGCEASTKILVTILDQLNDIYIPNFFNPNSAIAANSKFTVLGEYMTALDLKVFSPWGELLFETTSTSPTDGWNGTNKSGKEEPSGVYVYTARITLKNGGGTITRKGSVNLIR